MTTGEYVRDDVKKVVMMPRNPERTTLLSRDTASAIRYFCFNNPAEFYERFKNDLGMSRATFYRVMQGEYATPENVQYIELLAKRLKLTDKGGGSSYLVKGRLTSKFVELAQVVVSRGTIKSVEDLRVFLKENKGVLLS